MALDVGMPRPTRDYASTGVWQRVVRRTAATRPMTWLYIRIQRPVDEAVHRMSRGRTTLSSWVSGLPVVMLTTTGARSGQLRTVPLVGMPDGDRIIVIASNYGQAHYPAWYHNLRRNPRAVVSVRGVTRDVMSRELAGPEREATFQRAVGLYPGFRVYTDRAAHRRIPVVALEPYETMV